MDVLSDSRYVPTYLLYFHRKGPMLGNLVFSLIKSGLGLFLVIYHVNFCQVGMILLFTFHQNRFNYKKFVMWSATLSLAPENTL